MPGELLIYSAGTSHKSHEQTRVDELTYVCCWGRIGKPPQGMKEYSRRQGEKRHTPSGQI